jgi:hypothetical protein
LQNSSLQYGITPRNKWPFRITVFVLSALTLAFSAWIFRAELTEAYAYCRIRYAYHHCKGYLRPPDEVVIQCWKNGTAPPTERPHLATMPTEARYDPREPWCWKVLSEYQRQRLTTGVAPLFLHTRRTPSGEDRLIVLCPTYEGFKRYRPVPDRNNLILEPTKVTPTTGTVIWLYLFPADFHRFYGAVSVFAGQPDPNDRSTFTMRYEMNGEPGVIKANLRDDGTLELAASLPTSREHQQSSMVRNKSITSTSPASLPAPASNAR